MGEYLNTTEAAALARCHRSTVHKALEAGELHGGQRGKGGRWAIEPQCLKAWATGQDCPHAAIVVPFRRRRSA